MQYCNAVLRVSRFLLCISCVACSVCFTPPYSLRADATINPFAEKLILFVKRWSYLRQINGATQQMLSSYAWNVLVVHFLQRCNPPALPHLQSPQLLHGINRTSITRADGASFDCTFCSDLNAATQASTRTSAWAVICGRSLDFC